MAKMGRKKLEIDWEQFDKLCFIQCTLREIASWFDCSEDTIERRVTEEQGMRFAEYYDKKRGKGLVSLRRKQFDAALNGNTTLMIFLGKQYLGQKDQQAVDNTNTFKITSSELKEMADLLKE